MKLGFMQLNALIRQLDAFFAKKFIEITLKPLRTTPLTGQHNEIVPN